MVSYGPWQQDPDYDFPVTLDESYRTVAFPDSSLEYGAAYLTHENLEYIGITYTDLEAVQAHAVAFETDERRGHPAHVGNQITWGWSNGTIGEANWRSSAYASHDFHPWRVTPPAATYSPAWPEGAVGIEFSDTQESQWLAASMTPETILAGENWDYTQSPYGEPLSGSFTTTIQVSHGEPVGGWWDPAYGIDLIDINYADDGPEVVYRGIEQTVDMTPHLDAAGEVLIHTVTRTFLRPQRDPGVIDPSNTIDPYLYGWQIYTLGLAWLMRPPVYRWIYDTTPYRRTFPRDDALAGGAQRTFPPSKSLQSGRRTSGAYL